LYWIINKNLGGTSVINIEDMLICKVGWMEKYQGKEEPVSGPDQFVHDPEWGYEMYNFAPYKGSMYGYVQPQARNKIWFKAPLKIEGLGTSLTAEKIDDIFVVWVAKEPTSGETKVVGYYQNATVIRKIDRLVFSERFYPDNVLHTFRINADKAGCRLLNLEERESSPTIDLKGSGLGKASYLVPTEGNEAIRQSMVDFLTPFIPEEKSNDE
jgi:5-methylcytosine-specific restriction enzyme A